MEDKLSPTITSFSLGGETFNVPPRIPVEEIPEVTSPDRDGEGVVASNPLAKGVDLMDDALDLEIKGVGTTMVDVEERKPIDFISSICPIRNQNPHNSS